MLFVPADSERKLAGGVAGAADALIRDLEDSVAAERRAFARDMIADYLKTGCPRETEDSVR